MEHFYVCLHITHAVHFLGSDICSIMNCILTLALTVQFTLHCVAVVFSFTLFPVSSLISLFAAVWYRKAIGNNFMFVIRPIRGSTYTYKVETIKTLLLSTLKEFGGKHWRRLHSVVMSRLFADFHWLSISRMQNMEMQGSSELWSRE